MKRNNKWQISWKLVKEKLEIALFYLRNFFFFFFFHIHQVEKVCPKSNGSIMLYFICYFNMLHCKLLPKCLFTKFKYENGLITKPALVGCILFGWIEKTTTADFERLLYIFCFSPKRKTGIKSDCQFNEHTWLTVFCQCSVLVVFTSFSDWIYRIKTSFWNCVCVYHQFYG